MYSPINPKVEALAFMLAQHFHSPFPDGLVMRLGEGSEGNNIEAISSWRRAHEEMTGKEILRKASLMPLRKPPTN